MGVDPVTLGIAAISTIAGAATSAQQAHKKNDAIKRSEASAREAAAVQAKQLSEQEAQQRAARIQESRRLRASILAAGGASGFSLDSGDIVDSANANDAYASQDLATLAQNLQNSLDRVGSGLTSQLTSLSSEKASVGSSVFTGGLGGLTTGLSLSDHFDSIFNDPARQQAILDARNATKQKGFPLT